ncbi:MAG: sugar O-acetyltransferase [Trueperaceae bacterium]
MASEKEKMLRGELYNAADPQLTSERRRARELTKEFNDSRDEDRELRTRIMAELFGALGERIEVEPPFYCDYGSNIYLGSGVFFNFNCVILDVARVDIGDHVMFGPNVQVYTATHPMDAATRRSGLEMAKPVYVGSDVWLGGSAIIAPGVMIGSRTVIGAGSVVTRDIPEDVFAAGNPCRVIRVLEAGTA